ncbi:MAG: TlpA family protein disulfide reductase [Kiritimatiellae bacterium]|nr:TlpA family protein disulfide reductase [Kiritimatiellia bacterium]
MKHVLLLLCGLSALTGQAISFRALSDEAHISGPKLTEKDLIGRVIAVEEWGYQCPPCRASLPHMAKLAKSYEKDSRVAIVGSHLQDRNTEGILDVLRKNNCTYPVYQWFGVDGAPAAPGIPFAYVVNPKGEIVWQGNPYSKFGEFEKAIAEAAKLLPKLPPDSLLAGLEIVHCKDVIKRLVAGQNIEAVLRQLEAKANRGGAAGEEAEKIIAHCNQWAEEMDTEIRNLMETYPSKAIAKAQVYTRTLPKRTAELKQELATLAKDPIVNKLANSRVAFDKLKLTKADSTNAKKQLLSRAKMQLRQLGTLVVEDDNEDFKDVKALWEAFISTITIE